MSPKDQPELRGGASILGTPVDEKKLAKQVTDGTSVSEMMVMHGWHIYKERIENRILILDQRKDLLGPDDFHKYRAICIEIKVLRHFITEAARMVEQGKTAEQLLERMARR